ncbi:unnamed protein product [Clonostachys rhizophaga]|uniref:Zn(2)-C6 fungal-type domain-containing protein n=1 Tax=Clonostachys rhizophaga TaxID=160324 RepID=A0A9N9YFV8_9HYPO|nr:unnamed protein product [Clonostachys rhizophaga]
MESEGPEGLLARDAAGLRIWSCVTCRRRKVRCDRVDPTCKNCMRNGIECHYPVTGRLPRRRPAKDDSGNRAQRQDELISRLRRLEAVVTEMSAQVEEGAREQGLGENFSFQVTPRSSSASATASTPPSTGEAWPAPVDGLQAISEDDLGEDFGRLVVAKDGALHIGRRFWTVFCDEVDNIFRAVEDVEEGNDEAGALYGGTGSRASSSPQTSLGFASISSPVDDVYPSTSQMPLIWDTYIRKVDPFTKILHLPDVNTLFQSLQRRPVNTLSSANQALVAAISFGAMASMDSDQVEAHFGRPKSEMLPEFKKTAEQALMRANYMMTKDITVLRALVLYVAILPHIGCAELARPITGLVLRLAISMKLHKDGSHDEKMSLFEAEMRRRLWWHICFTDSCSRDPDIPPDLFVTEALFDTKMPLPIDSTDLVLMDAPTQPVEFKSGEVTLCLIRCEIWRAMRKLEPAPDKPLQLRLDIINTFRTRIETQYLQKLRPDVPFDTYIRTLVTLVFSKIEVVILLEGLRDRRLAGEKAGTVSDIILQSQIFAASLSVVESVLTLKTGRDYEDWRWHVHGHVPWHTMGIILRHLYRQPWGPVPERAWIATKAVFDILPKEASADPLWKPLNDLITKTALYRQQCSSSISRCGAEEALLYDPTTSKILQEVAVQHQWEAPVQLHHQAMNDFTADSAQSAGEMMVDPAILDAEGWQSWAGMIGVGSIF